MARIAERISSPLTIGFGFTGAGVSAATSSEALMLSHWSWALGVSGAPPPGASAAGEKLVHCMRRQCSLRSLPQARLRCTAKRVMKFCAHGGQRPPKSSCWQTTTSRPGPVTDSGRSKYALLCTIARTRSARWGKICSSSKDFIAMAMPSTLCVGVGGSDNCHRRCKTSRSENGHGARRTKLMSSVGFSSVAGRRHWYSESESRSRRSSGSTSARCTSAR
mmetsp:Transcript_17615/g.45430  ORF Transcript_17615/g.45430 Transcript_17615/m.45430 type:complete len:220 (-) Transcript_17615:323-982(-)